MDVVGDDFELNVIGGVLVILFVGREVFYLFD